METQGPFYFRSLPCETALGKVENPLWFSTLDNCKQLKSETITTEVRETGLTAGELFHYVKSYITESFIKRRHCHVPI